MVTPPSSILQKVKFSLLFQVISWLTRLTAFGSAFNQAIVFRSLRGFWRRCQKECFSSKGFSLVEVLITIALLGIVAAFTIPPLFQMPNASLKAKYMSRATSTAFMLMSAYEQYKAANGGIFASTRSDDLTPYLQYVAVDSTTTMDNLNGYTTLSCTSGAGGGCLKLHNGAMLRWWVNNSFGTTNGVTSLGFILDPDGRQTDSTTNGIGKSLSLFLMNDGHVYSQGTLPGTVWYKNGGWLSYTACPSCDPSWFSGF